MTNQNQNPHNNGDDWTWLADLFLPTATQSAGELIFEVLLFLLRLIFS